MINLLMMKRRIILWTMCVFVMQNLQAQPASAQHRPAQKLAYVPFEQLYGGVMLIRGQVADRPDTLNFIFDTGSGGISLDSATVEQLRLPLTRTNQVVTGIGGQHRVQLVESQPIKLVGSGLRLDSLNFTVNNYELLSESYGIRIDGIVGYAFISRYILNVDFDSSKIFVYSKGQYKYPRRGYVWKYRLIYLPNTSLQVKDRSTTQGQYYIDTGAGLAMLFTEEFAADSGLIVPGKKVVVTQVDGMGGKAATRLTTVKEVKLGPYKFKSVPAYLYDDKFNVINYPAGSGLIGNDILRRFNWVLNYDKKEMHLLPNTSFNDPFDYAYTGLSIYFIDGAVRVTDVVPGGPGEKAGFLEDDVVISVDGVPVNNNITKVKSLLQDARRNLRVVVLREGVEKVLLIRVVSIL
jgi:hypothetical protein